jgi:DNA-binding NarL/FixJ family response regulator
VNISTGVQARIFLVDDYVPFLDFVSSLVHRQPGLRIIGKVQDGTEAIREAGSLKPDLILLDIGLPGLNGIEAAYRIRKIVPRAKIVFLTNDCSPEVVEEALKLGASGYVLKVYAAQDLPSAINAALNGDRFLSRGLGQYSLENLTLATANS